MQAKPAFRLGPATFSGPVSGRNPRNCGNFQRFSMECSPDSLQPRLRGGARSPALTILCENSLLTGKNTGNFFISGQKVSHHRSYSIHSARFIGATTLNETGNFLEISGNHDSLIPVGTGSGGSLNE